jgi:SAM-dependent methyltransferase
VDEAGGAGEICCPAGHRFGMREGYLDCSQGAVADGSTGRTFASFGFEWNNFDEVRDEDERFAEVYFRDLDLTSLDGKIGLDAGCGKGRYTRFLAEHLAATAALDGSSAVEAAARNLAGRPSVVVVKSDLRTAPFAPGSFDFISSLGVLHHLDDPREGFDRLLAHLAPGGRILLYLYSRPPRFGLRAVALSLAAALRTATVRLPHRLLKVLSAPVAAGLYWGVVVPGAYGDRRGVAGLAGLPMGAYRGKPFRSLVLDTFDRLSAPVEHRYVWKDLAPWFSETGMEVDAARDETGWFILARKSDR